MSHHAHIYYTLEQFLASLVSTEQARRRGIRSWKIHLQKHGHVPMIRKCAICSGREQRIDVKRGHYKASRPTKSERDEVRGTLSE